MQMTMADNRNVIGATTFEAVYHWTQVYGERQDDSRHLFTNGSQMDQRSIEQWENTPFPLPFAGSLVLSRPRVRSVPSLPLWSNAWL